MMELWGERDEVELKGIYDPEPHLAEYLYVRLFACPQRYL